ncbi:hypothetical protein [Aquimarina algicola]|uniref:Uncharacterized protein n=1 Tax=Aquimarina algicola TaxID=2589995 RepID=A0A504JEY0_9FLAO|nr:hypothetical protein [Aquimarina algicola]TPN86288.1 hypothetical protein FHK87_13560 [Aquimarina algicola]
MKYRRNVDKYLKKEQIILKIKNLLFSFLLLQASFIFSQENFWIYEYKLTKGNYEKDFSKSYKESCKGVLKQTNDSILTWSFGKEDFEDAFKKGGAYIKRNDSLEIKHPKGKKSMYSYLSNDTLKFYQDKNNIQVYRRIRANKKIKLEKIHEYLNGHNFIVDFSMIYGSDIKNEKIITLKNYHGKNINLNSDKYFYRIIEIEKNNLFISGSRFGSKLFPIIDVNEEKMIIFCSHKSGDLVEFRRVK